MDPTAAIIHLQGNFLFHLAMAAGVIFVKSTNTVAVINLGSDCLDHQDTYQFQLNLCLGIHVVCSCAVLLSYASTKFTNFGFQTFAKTLLLVCVPVYQGTMLYLLGNLKIDVSVCQDISLLRQQKWFGMEVLTFAVFGAMIIMILFKSRYTEIGLL